jgi:hypothetical protein
MRGRRLQKAALRLISINQIASRQRRSRQARGRRGTVRGSRSHVGLRPVAPMTLLLTRQYMKPSTSPLPIPSIALTSTNPSIAQSYKGYVNKSANYLGTS